MRETTEQQVDKYLLEKAARERPKSSLDGLDYFCLVICVMVALESAFGLWLVSQLPRLPLLPIR